MSCTFYCSVPLFSSVQRNWTGLCEQHSKRSDGGISKKWAEEVVEGDLMKPNTRTVPGLD